MELDSRIWGPHFWFFLHTIAMTYPHYPTSENKKKIYELIRTFPLFLPNKTMSANFADLIDTYPVAPYLDNRETFIKWVFFIHNIINERLEKPKISLSEFYKLYYDQYKPTETKMIEYIKLKQKIIYITILFLFVFLIYYFSDK
jgi:hypothetical protein